MKSCGFTGRTLESQPHVLELKLIDCPHANAEGLKHMIAAALPAVKSLAFQASHASTVVQMTQQIVGVLVCGRNLEAIDLRGVHGLTSRLLSELRKLFVQQAKLGRAKPSVTLQLPFWSLGQHQPLPSVCRHLYIPTLQIAPGQNKSRLMYTNGQHKVATIPFCSAVLYCFLSHRYSGVSYHTVYWTCLLLARSWVTWKEGM